MKIEVKTGDILNERSDVLICSANVYLNQSGGVGGEILRRYGDTMQQALREQLRSTGRQFVNQGDLIETPGFDTGFKYVLHAVAVNVWYETSAEIVERLLVNAFVRASALNSTTVSTAALGTGYGRLAIREFGRGFKGAISRPFPPVESICVVVSTAANADELRSELGI